MTARAALSSLAALLVLAGCPAAPDNAMDAARRTDAPSPGMDAPRDAPPATDGAAHCARNTDCPAGQVCSAQACVAAGFGFTGDYGCDALDVAAGATGATGDTPLFVGGGAYETDLFVVHGDGTVDHPGAFASALQTLPARLDARDRGRRGRRLPLRVHAVGSVSARARARGVGEIGRERG